MNLFIDVDCGAKDVRAEVAQPYSWVPNKCPSPLFLEEISDSY